MSEIATPEKEKDATVKVRLKFLPFMCENAPTFRDIDTVMSLLPLEGIKHKQREIWKMMPKMENGRVVRDEDGYMIMVKVVTRTSKIVTVKNDQGIHSITTSGVVEPMDYTDMKEVITILNGK